jgi:hypothetical protein
MATGKTKTAAAAPAAAGTTATTGAATGTVAHTDTGVTDGNQAHTAGGADAAGSDWGAADSGGAAGGEGLPTADADAAASPASAMAAGAVAAFAPVGNDDVQAPAKSDAGGAAAAAFAPPTVNEMLADLREIPPDNRDQLRKHLSVMTAAFDVLDREREAAQAHGEFSFADALLASPARPAGRRAVVLFSAGAVRHPIGDLVEGTDAQIASLASSGDVDPHPDAVDAAVARGALVHTLGL